MRYLMCSCCALLAACGADGAARTVRTRGVSIGRQLRQRGVAMRMFSGIAIWGAIPDVLVHHWFQPRGGIGHGQAWQECGQ